MDGAYAAWSYSADDTAGDGNRRGAERAHVEIPASLRRAGRTAFTVTLRDLSRTGCRGETLSRVNTGDRVWITLPGFAPLEGMVRWSGRDRFGCEWLTPIHPSIHEHICKAYPDLTGGG